MRRFALPLIILASVALAALLAWFALTRASFGDRAPTSESRVVRTLPPFTRVDVSGAADVVLVQGTTESVAVAQSGRRPGRIDTEVQDGTLYIEAHDNSRWWHFFVGSGGSSRTAQVVVTFRELEAIATAGGVKVTSAGIKSDVLKIAGAGGTSLRLDNLTANQLRLAGAGATKAELSGRVTDLTVAISGAGEYRGSRLVSQNATVTVAGAAQVIVNAEKTLKATISGAGSVEYLGDPQVTERISGVGRVRRRDAMLQGPPRLAIAQ